MEENVFDSGGDNTALTRYHLSVQRFFGNNGSVVVSGTRLGPMETTKNCFYILYWIKTLAISRQERSVFPRGLNSVTLQLCSNISSSHPDLVLRSLLSDRDDRLQELLNQEIINHNSNIGRKDKPNVPPHKHSLCFSFNQLLAIYIPLCAIIALLCYLCVLGECYCSSQRQISVMTGCSF